MELKYKLRLAHYKIEDLTDTCLDKAFVEKAKNFESALQKGTLTDEEIATMDSELCELFDNLHEFEDVDNEEVTQLKMQNTILAAKEAANNTDDLTILQELKTKYPDFPEILQYIDGRAKVILAKEKVINDKNEADKVKIKTIQQKLLSKKDWCYNELLELGINPTGEDMIVEGVILKRQYMFKVYIMQGLVKST